MRNLYVEERKQSFKGLWQTVSFAVLFVFMASFTFAQTEMVWTGAENNRFTNENNWDPAGSPIGNILTIPMPDTASNAAAQPYVVEVTGGEDISVSDLTVAGASDDAYQSRIVIMLDDTATFSMNPKIKYGFTGVQVKSGTFSFRRTNAPRLDGANTWLRVEGGRAEFNNLAMGNGKGAGSAGKIYITGGEVYLYDTFFREEDVYEDGQVLITGDGKLTVTGNYTPISERWVNGGDDYSIARVYDAINNITVFTAVSSDYVGIENSGRQVLKNNEVTTDTLMLIQTNAVANATTFEWRYRAAGSDTYTSFAGGNTASFAPSFASSGTFYVSCLVDGVATDNEAEFFVVSDAIAFLPAEFPFQIVRVGEMGTTMTADFTGTPSSIEWKYSTVPGGPYQSFEPAATAASYQPSFDAEGNVYVIVEAVIDGNTHSSVELLYNVESASSTGKGLTWTGLVSTDATDPANWNPVASPTKNNFYVKQLDSIDGVPPMYPVWKSDVNDTTYTFGVDPGAEAIFDFGDDSLNIRGSWQEVKGGTMHVVSGYIESNPSYFRMTNMGMLKLSGDAYFYAHELLYEDGKGNGGQVSLEDNAVLHCEVLPWRVVADTLESVTYISDNARIEYEGDQRTSVQAWIDALKIVCPDEGFEPIMVYDESVDLTIVQAVNTNAFAIANDEKTYTTANIPIGEPITLTNVDGVTGWEWKYGTNVSGPWMSFDPAVTDEPEFYPAFAESGTYYIVAETTDGTLTYNMKTVVVIDLGITPSADQEINYGVDGDTLMAVIPEQFTVSAIAWYYRISGSDEAFETGVTDSIFVPNFASVGEYDVFYGVEVQDEFGVQYFLQSSSVHIVVGNVGVNDLALGSLTLYPNPTTGAFYIKGNLQDDYVLEIFDITGNVVHKQRYIAGTTEAVEFSGNGVYFVRMTSDTETRIGRLVVE